MACTNIDAAVTDAQRTGVLAAIAHLGSNLAFLIHLPPQKRQALPKMGSVTQSFVSKSLKIASNNPQFVPLTSIVRPCKMTTTSPCAWRASRCSSPLY